MVLLVRMSKKIILANTNIFKEQGSRILQLPFLFWENIVSYWIFKFSG